MKVLVTGGTGFLGKRLAYRLKELGYDTTVYGRNEKIGAELKKDGIRFKKGELHHYSDVRKAVKGNEYVFHCGAKSSPWGSYSDFFQSNYRGTENVIRACRKHRTKRLIYVSTPSIYFSFEHKTDVKEHDPLSSDFMNDYAETKYFAEKLIKEAHERGLPVISIRPRAIFGPGDTTLIPRLIDVHQKKFIPLIDGGKHQMDLTYVDNVVDALILCMNSPTSTLGQFYNITNGEPVVFKEVVEALFQEMNIPLKTKKIGFRFAFTLATFLEWFANTFQKGKEPLLTRYTVTVLAKSQTLNIDKAKKELGYVPRVSIQKGMQEFVKWWEKQP